MGRSDGDGLKGGRFLRDRFAGNDNSQDVGSPS